MENKSKLKVEEDGDPLLSLHASLYLAGLHKNNNFETACNMWVGCGMQKSNLL